MQVAEWSENMETYDISSEYSIRKADPEEWGIYCSVYYNMRFVGFFEKSGSVLTEIMRIGSTRENRKLVGYGWHPILYIILFFIPPFNQSFEVLKLLKKILVSWSDRTQAIKAFEILPDQVHLFAKAGFRCRWMQRPTERFDVTWDDDLIIKSPQITQDETGTKRFTNENEIAHCDFASFVGGFEALRRNQSSFEQFIPDEDPSLTNEVLTEASTLVYDRSTGELVANCRICLQDTEAAVYSIGVIPSHRGRGIATYMLQRALTILKGKYPILRLYVMEGNDAESVYYNLGFIPGVQEVQQMIIPAESN